MTFYIETVERVRRKASGNTKGSVGRDVGKRWEVRRKAPGGTEESAVRCVGKRREVRRNK